MLTNQAKISALENDILMIREKNDEAVLAQQSKLLNAEKAHSSELQNQLSQVQLQLSVCKEQRNSEVSELESRLRVETESAKELDNKLRTDIRVSIFFLRNFTSLTAIESGITS